MKKIVITSLMVCTLLLTSSLTVFAMDSRITSSGHHTGLNSSYTGIYGYGYTTSKYKHYTSVRLWDDDGDVTTSDREWGTGSVSAITEYLRYYSSDSYGTAVYYGF